MNNYIPKKSKYDPNENGHFGKFGGRYVPETLMPILIELDKSYKKYRFDKEFWNEVNYYLKEYVGRPNPLYHAANISEELECKVYLKREDLNHTGAHKINNVIAQGLLAKKLGKSKVIAETGAGQHGVATATIAALMGLECTVFMGAKDVKRQELNVFRMKLLGAKVIAVESGSRSLKDAMNDAIRYWVTNARDTFYVIGTVAGPHPYPMMVRDFQAIIGWEARQQILEKENRLPDNVIACIGGGSNAIGMFSHFLDDKEVACIGIEAGGLGIDTNSHGCSLEKGSPGILHGQCSYLLQTTDGQINEAHSISAGLDYPGIGPEHSYHYDLGTVQYDNAIDEDAKDAFVWLSQKEGITPAFETAHAMGYIKKHKEKFKDKLLIVSFSGRGDKDMQQAQKLFDL
ncbi:MAG: tryptophan synthase subunit beta [Campylobacterota bacterium]|nr:tryptophan synthase subunit beta [Campylobacterota bacterium]